MGTRSLLFFVFVTLITIFIFSFDSKFYSVKHLIGKWEGEYNGEMISILFTENGKFELSYKYPDTAKYQKITGVYHINLLKNPISMSIKKINEINENLFTIIRFDNENTIVISKFATRWRLSPVSFMLGNYIFLNRVNMNISN